MKPLQEDRIFQELSNEYKIVENGVRMQKLSTFEVGEVGWAGALARNTMNTWSKTLWKVVTHARAGADTHARARARAGC